MTKPNYTCQNCNTQFQPKSPKKNRVPKFCCRDCYFEFRFKKNPNKITTKEFVIRSRAVHGDKYDYSKTTYTKSRNKVVITCPVHGDFEQAPLEHYGGFGCKECANDAKRLDREMFVEHSQKKHNNYYSYDKVGEVRDKKDILTITCPKHGDFEQTPKSHAQGSGCPDCGMEARGFGRSDFILACDRNGGGYGILYIIKCFNDSEEFYKVGITSTSIERRMSGDISMPYDYVVEYSHKERAEFVFDLETTIHRLLRNKTYQPEIFFAGHTECFESIKPIKRLIERLTNSKQLQLIA